MFIQLLCFLDNEKLRKKSATWPCWRWHILLDNATSWLYADVSSGRPSHLQPRSNHYLDAQSLYFILTFDPPGVNHWKRHFWLRSTTVNAYYDYSPPKPQINHTFNTHSPSLISISHHSHINHTLTTHHSHIEKHKPHINNTLTTHHSHIDIH